MAGSNRQTSSDPLSILEREFQTGLGNLPLVLQRAVAQEGVRHVKSEFTGRPLQSSVVWVLGEHVRNLNDDPNLRK